MHGLLLALYNRRGEVATEDQEVRLSPGRIDISSPGKNHLHRAIPDESISYISLITSGEVTFLTPDCFPRVHMLTVIDYIFDPSMTLRSASLKPTLDEGIL